MMIDSNNKSDYSILATALDRFRRVQMYAYKVYIRTFCRRVSENTTLLLHLHKTCFNTPQFTKKKRAKTKKTKKKIEI